MCSELCETHVFNNLSQSAATDALPRLMKKRARLAAAANDAQQRVEASKTQKQAYAEELEGLELRISSLRSTLDTELIPAEADAQARFTSVKEQSTKVTSRMEALQNKQVCCLHDLTRLLAYGTAAFDDFVLSCRIATLSSKHARNATLSCASRSKTCLNS